MSYQIARQDIADIRARVEAACPDDADLLADMMEGETELHALLSWAFGKIEAEQAEQAALSEQISNRTARKKRAKAREDSVRNVALELLLLSGVPSVKLPEATFSVTNGKPSIKVTDASALPISLTITGPRKPLPIADIRAWVERNPGDLPSGLTRTNGTQYLTVRTK